VAVREEVLQRQSDIGLGRLTVFAAGRQPVRDNEGKEVIPAGQRLSDADILGMNWFVEGVVGKLPR